MNAIEEGGRGRRAAGMYFICAFKFVRHSFSHVCAMVCLIRLCSRIASDETSEVERKRKEGKVQVTTVHTTLYTVGKTRKKK